MHLQKLIQKLRYDHTLLPHILSVLGFPSDSENCLIVCGCCLSPLRFFLKFSIDGTKREHSGALATTMMKLDIGLLPGTSIVTK